MVKTIDPISGRTARFGHSTRHVSTSIEINEIPWCDRDSIMLATGNRLACQTRACRLPRAASMDNRQMLISTSGFGGQSLRITCSGHQDQCTVSAFRNAAVSASSAVKSKSHGDLTFCGRFIFFSAASASQWYIDQTPSGAI